MKELQRMAEKLGVRVFESKDLPSHYNGTHQIIVINKSQGDPATILAHELGHRLAGPSEEAAWRMAHKLTKVDDKTYRHSVQSRSSRRS